MTEEERKRNHRNKLARENRARKRIARIIVNYSLTEKDIEKAVLLAMKQKLGV